MLKACGGLSRDSYGRTLRTHLIKARFVFDVIVASSLVSLYAKCKFFYAIQLFDEMLDRDVASWNIIISCYY